MMTRKQHMRRIAIERVLARRDERAAIGSLTDLRRAYEAELAAHGAEIAAQVDEFFARLRSICAGILRKKLRCAMCGGEMEPKRLSRRYCSDRCRQRAHRQAR
jgi:hypothetical protein